MPIPIAIISRKIGSKMWVKMWVELTFGFAALGKTDRFIWLSVKTFTSERDAEMKL